MKKENNLKNNGKKFQINNSNEEVNLKMIDNDKNSDVDDEDSNASDEDSDVSNEDTDVSDEDNKDEKGYYNFFKLIKKIICINFFNNNFFK